MNKKYHNVRDSKGRFTIKTTIETRIKKQKEPKKEIYDIVLLDESSSMDEGNKRMTAIDGFNQHIENMVKTNKKVKLDTFCSLMIFSSYNTRMAYTNKSLELVSKLTKENYKPYGGTPLYNSIVTIVSYFKKELKNKQNTDVTITIITDGEDNSWSTSSLEKAKNCIKRAKDLGWTIAFIGAGDPKRVESYIKKLDIEESNYIIVEDSAEGLTRGISSLSAAREIKTTAYAETGKSINVGFFSKKK